MFVSGVSNYYFYSHNGAGITPPPVGASSERPSFSLPTQRPEHPLKQLLKEAEKQRYRLFRAPLDAGRGAGVEKNASKPRRPHRGSGKHEMCI
jgi:hypothetical protein